MIISFLVLSVTVGIISCADQKSAANCGTPATLLDRHNLDGCGWMLELEDGTMLRPTFSSEIRSSLDFEDRMEVKIDYKELTDQLNICMAGKPVLVTCIIRN